MLKNFFFFMGCLGVSPIVFTNVVTPDGGNHATTPNDPLFSKQWGWYNNEYGYDIGALGAWQIEKGSKNIAIVIIGTGVDYTHPDLKNNMWVNPGEIAGNGIDDDNNGYIDDIHGVNVIDGTGDPMDDVGHETAIAGIIGAEANNGIGIAGVMHYVSLIACKFLSASGTGSTHDAIKCFNYVESLAKRNNTGATIIATNNSWGGDSFSAALEEAIQRQRDLGILFVTTAGNDALNLDEHPIYPASYDVANIIVVGKLERDGHHRESGSFGPNTVHLAAPGAGLVSTWINGTYRELSGTFSVAFAAGVLGLIKSHRPTLNWIQLKHQLLVGVKKLPFEEEQRLYISGGYCNALGSLQ
jgi:serine protease